MSFIRSSTVHSYLPVVPVVKVIRAVFAAITSLGLIRGITDEGDLSSTELGMALTAGKICYMKEYENNYYETWY